MMNCRKFLADQDMDRYRLSLFQTDEVRKIYWGLACFDCEINAIDAKVSEPHIRQIRYQWWREQLRQLESDVPISHPLIQYLKAYHFESKTLIQRLNEREQWGKLKTLDTLIERAKETKKYYEAVGYSSETIFVYDLISQIRHIFYKAHRGIMVLPQALLDHFEVHETDFLTCRIEGQMHELLNHLRIFLDDSVATVNDDVSAKHKSEKRLAYHGVAYDHYRKKLNKFTNFYHPHFIKACPKLIFKLIWTNIF